MKHRILCHSVKRETKRFGSGIGLIAWRRVFALFVMAMAIVALPPATAQAMQLGNQGGDDAQDGDDQDQSDNELPVGQNPDLKPGERDSAGLRIFERDPYDELHTRNKDNREEVDVTWILPFRFAEGDSPETMRPSDVIYVRLIGNDREYEVKWGDVVELRPFNQVVLAEANALVEEGRFNEAFDYFDFLQKSNSDLILRDRPEIVGLQESINGYLFKESQQLVADGDADAALSLLFELYGRDASYAGLADGLAAIIDARVQSKFDEQEYAAAQRLLRSLSDKFPENATVTKWQTQFEEQSRARYAEAQALLEAGEVHDARSKAIDAVQIWPIDEVNEFLTQVQNLSPRIVVAVEAAAPDNPSPVALDDWASRRAGRLLHRSPAEFIAPGPQGGEYQYPLGELQVEALENRLTYNVRPGMTWYPSGREVTGYDLAELLNSMSQPTSSNFAPGWRSLLESARLRRVYDVEFLLTSAHVAPHAYLAAPLSPWDQQSGKATATNGPFFHFDTRGRDSRFRSAEGYFATGERQPREVVERRFTNWQDAAGALVDREVAVVDRIAPWDVDRLRQIPYLRVEQYAVPTIHCLVPNRDRLLPGSRTFRRGLLMGLNREVLMETLFQGPASPGSRVISGPFPAARDVTDVLGYAYDEDVESHPYDPQMGMILATAAKKLVSNHLEEQGAEPLPENPPIVLALPPHDTARVICRGIKQQWERLGLSVELKEQAASDPSDDYDFRLLELQIFEPLVDAQRLLGRGGAAEARNAYVGLALEQLQRAQDWREVGERLQEIHLLVHQDVTLLPLWQITEYFAYHGSLREVTNPNADLPPVTLYQYIESWQSPPALLPDNL